MNQFLSSEHNKTKHGTSRGTSIRLIARETWQTWMSSSHKVIWTIEILRFCSYDLSTGLPTLWDGQPHVCLLQCDIDRGQKHQ